MRRVRVHISGDVQGVFFRASCADLARGSAVSGWVRNDAGGGVEAVFEGDDTAVEQMVGWCRDGPPHARVERVEAVDEPPTGETGFRVVR